MLTTYIISETLTKNSELWYNIICSKLNPVQNRSVKIFPNFSVECTGLDEENSHSASRLNEKPQEVAFRKTILCFLLCIVSKSHIFETPFNILNSNDSSMNRINPETGEVVPRTKSPRFQLWISFLVFATITTFSSIALVSLILSYLLTLDADTF